MQALGKMSTSLTNIDGDTEIKMDSKNKSNNRSSVNEKWWCCVRLSCHHQNSNHLERRGKISLWYEIILLNALNIVMMIHMLNAIIVIRCIHVIQEGMKAQLWECIVKKNSYQLKDNKVNMTQTKLVFKNKNNDENSKKVNLRYLPFRMFED